MTIILLGYMGCGKSTVGKELAKMIDFSFSDLDDVIVEETQLEITQIFETKGPIYFRKIESEALVRQIETNENQVFALGGGTPCYAGNMNWIKEADGVISIYLKLSVNSLVNRLKDERSKRPLIAHLEDDELTEFIAKHLFERNPYYLQADLILNCDGKNVKVIANEIQKWLGQVNSKFLTT